jgi:hypothetical protein
MGTAVAYHQDFERCSSIRPACGSRGRFEFLPMCGRENLAAFCFCGAGECLDSGSLQRVLMREVGESLKRLSGWGVHHLERDGGHLPYAAQV